MSNSLIELIKRESEGFSSVVKITDEESNTVSENIKDKFSVGDEESWWWEKNKKETNTIFYGDKLKLEVLRECLYDDTVFLIVTDDNPPPWEGFKGRLFDILDIIGEIYLFEFHIVKEDFSWVIFDTHHNEFVVKGSDSLIREIKEKTVEI